MSHANLFGGGEDLIQNGIIIVDPVNGNDGTGERNNLSKPFLTLAGAKGVYQDGDLIDVLSGTLTLTATELFSFTHDIHINFRPGSIVTADMSFTLIGKIGASGILHIYGQGVFRNDNTAPWNGSANFAGEVWIHSAKSISTGGAIQNIGNTWVNIENVEEFYNERTGARVIALQNNPLFEDPKYGNIKNCNIGRLTDSSVAIRMESVNTDQNFYIENCNLYSNNQAPAISIGSIETKAIYQNCVIKSADSRAYVGFCGEFNNCHFITDDASLEAVLVQNNNFDSNGIYPVFTDCTFRSNGAGRAIRTSEPAMFNGTNRMYSAGVEAAYGNGDRVNKNNGTIIANIMDSVTSPQAWQFRTLTEPPTVGEIYTIEAPDGATISYTVQVADTMTEVINGLASAWDAEVLAEPLGIFAKFDNKVVNTGPSLWRITATAINEYDNLPITNGFQFYTDGSDSITLNAFESLQFSWKGAGKFIIDENLIIPNY
jgi:hypothetical protein